MSRQKKHLFRQLAVAATIAIALNACASDTPPQTASETATATAPAASQSSESGQEATRTAQVAIDEDSPIEALLGVPVFDEDAMNAWFRDLDIERQRITAECMLAEGFSYTPELVGAPSGPRAELSTTSREFAATYGFGIGDSFNAAEFDPAKDYTTENSRYIATLTEGETEAYYLALGGTPLDEDEFSDFPAGGCEGSAFEEVFAVIGVMDAVTPVVDTYYERFISDSRMLALATTWQECMSEAGFVYADTEEMRESFYQRLNRIVGSDAAYQQVDMPDDLPEPDFVFSGDVYGVHPKLTDEAQQELDGFIAEEIATAVANWDCREPLIEDELRIQREYEAQIVDEIEPAVRELLADN